MCGSKTLDKHGKCWVCGHQLDLKKIRRYYSKREWAAMGLEEIL